MRIRAVTVATTALITATLSLCASHVMAAQANFSVEHTYVFGPQQWNSETSPLPVTPISAAFHQAARLGDQVSIRSSTVTFTGIDSAFLNSDATVGSESGGVAGVNTSISVFPYNVPTNPENPPNQLHYDRLRVATNGFVNVPDGGPDGSPDYALRGDVQLSIGHGRWGQTGSLSWTPVISGDTIWGNTTPDGDRLISNTVQAHWNDEGAAPLSSTLLDLSYRYDGDDAGVNFAWNDLGLTLGATQNADFYIGLNSPYTQDSGELSLSIRDGLIDGSSFASGVFQGLLPTIGGSAESLLLGLGGTLSLAYTLPVDSYSLTIGNLGNISPVPEPAAYQLVLLGLLGLAMARRARRKPLLQA